ncbi:hypothetical protein N0V82_006690 [Gnomoniopsis sp. IMI 355080]|nr:hypothetical protein N0V82_006690 [Gnomoniopsis sp. IMI 355080]
MVSFNATLPSSAIARLPQLLAGLNAESITSKKLTPSSPLSILLSLALFLIVTYAAHQRALPKPLPGIPYNAAAARRLLGDLPELYSAARTRDMRNYMSSLATRHASPIVQLLGIRMTGRGPTVVINDFATTQDILLRRSHEFDRPPNMLESLRGVLPYHHIAMRTADPQFKRNRELVKDLMTPAFLHGVNAPEIWRGAERFVDLWRLKARVAGGRPFLAKEDVSRMMFDIIRNVAIGKGETTLLGTYMRQLRAKFGTYRAPRAVAQERVPFVFPEPPYDETLEAQDRMNKALTPAVPVPPRWYHAINNRTSNMREAYASKERMLKKQINLAVRRMEAGEPLESALDYMIKRELGSAKKEDRAPVFDSPYMLDELYGYLGAGHDTTATTFQWGMKHLAQHPEVQKKARDSLRAVFKDAYAEGRQPSQVEIVKHQVPYVDAIIEEILRLSGPVGATARTTTVDTVIMGHHIPKGTTVIMSSVGPGFTSPSVQMPADVDGYKRPATYTKRVDWDGMSPESFLPERWLTENENGDVVYDAQAGPFLAFSLGIRGCFGIRLAYLTLRMLFTMLLWNFELDSVPEELDSWKAVQILTRKPVQCYVRLTEVTPGNNA